MPTRPQLAFLYTALAGAAVIAIGLGTTWATVEGDLPAGWAFPGLYLAAGGLIVFLFGVVRFLARRATPEELAAANPGDFRTWQIRPQGLLLILVCMFGPPAALGFAARHAPDWMDAARVLTGFLVALLFVAFAVPPVRRLFFVEPKRGEPPAQ